MEIFKNLFSNGKGDKNQNNGQENGEQAQSEESQNQEEVTAGTKIKVVAALVVVGFAAYVAYWIQEPAEVRSDLLASSSMQSMQGTQGMSMQAGATQQTQEVAIENFSFNPATLNIDKGTTVVWTNKDQVPHNVVADDFASPTLNPGDTFTYTFNSDGTFSYKCTFHPQMKAFVIVGTGASTQAQSKDEVLSGFGAGSSLALETPTQEAAATTETPAQAIEQTPAQTPPPETIYTSSAQAPLSAEELHNAALQSLGSSLSNIGAAVSAQGSTPLYPEQTMTTAQQPQTVAELTPPPAKKGKLAGSGPEDFVYAGMFGLVLFLNRRKLRKFQKNLR